MNQHDNSRVQRFDHPGRGRERARPVPKGRQVDPTAKVEIEALLGDRSRQRDLYLPVCIACGFIPEGPTF